MRGALHLVAPDTGPALLSLIAAAKPWARPGWDRYFDMNEARWSAYFDAVRRALDGTTLSREELVAAIAATPGLGHLADGLRSGWGTLLKPLAWSGELCFGPSRGSRVTFRRPADASSEWTGLPAPEDAAPVAVEAYFGAYGPATLEAFGHWMGGGWLRKRALREMVDAHGSGRLVEVDVEGRRAFVLAEHVDGLAAARPSSAVRLLPNFDAWVLGPGSRDEQVVPPARLAAVSRQAGWISPVVLAGGRRRRHLAARRRAPRSREVPGSRRPPGRQARSRSRPPIQHRRSSAIAQASPARKRVRPDEPRTASIRKSRHRDPRRRWAGLARRPASTASERIRRCVSEERSGQRGQRRPAAAGRGASTSKPAPSQVSTSRRRSGKAVSVSEPRWGRRGSRRGSGFPCPGRSRSSGRRPSRRPGRRG